jgi:hypothetical protein
MKTVSRLLILASVVSVLYFATVGRNDFYRIWDAVEGVIAAVASNYVLMK